jgi:hypothetical protein
MVSNIKYCSQYTIYNQVGIRVYEALEIAKGHHASKDVPPCSLIRVTFVSIADAVCLKYKAKSSLHHCGKC